MDSPPPQSTTDHQILHLSNALQVKGMVSNHHTGPKKPQDHQMGNRLHLQKSEGTDVDQRETTERAPLLAMLWRKRSRPAPVRLQKL
mgnify:CR=1 FL=1